MEKMCGNGERLTRSALGRLGFIGELYDVRTESFTSRSIFKSSLPRHFIRTLNVTGVSIDYKFTENLSDRFDLLKVEAETQVSLLCGLLEAEGCGKFLNEEKQSGKTISCSLMCKFETVCEKLFAPFEEIVDCLDLTALDDPEGTHVVVEVNWGANCCLDLKKNCNTESERKQVEGLLRAEIKKLVKLVEFEGEGEFDFEKSSLAKSDDVKIKVIADVSPESEIPTSVESFCQFLRNIPNLLKKCNGGKGKPLSYALIPMSHFRKVARLEKSVESAIKSIDESFLISTVCLFEEIASVKEKLLDFVQETIDHRNYLPACEEIANAKSQLDALKLKECRLKSIVAEDWVSIKSGRLYLRDLIKKIEKFKSRDLNLCGFEEYLNSSKWIRKRISTVQNYLSHGVEYLERGKRFSDELNKNPSMDFVVLLVSTEFENSDPALYQSTCYHFLTLVANKELPSAKYVVVDLDFDKGERTACTNWNFFSKLGIANVKCSHFRGGKIFCSDMYKAYSAEKQTNFARFTKGSEVDRYRWKPGNRATLEMTCPGFEAGTCSLEKLDWNCFRCKEKLEYGFDDYYYCSCGRNSSELYEYRCSHDGHGASFVSAKRDFLIDQLSVLRPFKELNILVLGQSGVGKSTWINSVTNYLSYDSLEEAKENGVICTIPIAFTAYDRETGEKKVIQIGGETDGELIEIGKSATQFCSTYTFLWEGRYVRLIDTPGIGDTRGIQKDKENMRNIIDHVSHLKELHGVCVLMKANDCRINAIFSYCLNELLTHMHKSIAKNIVFCFTNARNSFYTPGQTSVLLEKQLDSLRMHETLSLGPHNRFCLDNEAFLFLCTLKNSGIRHDENLTKSFAQSWEISLKESQRLFRTIKNFRPHSLHDTLSLFGARCRILSLSKPIAEISKTIQMNLTAIARRKQELDVTEKTLEELSKKLHFSEIHLQPVPLNMPRTVCTSPKCVEYHKIEGVDITEIEYVTHCHRSCHLQNVETKALNNALLIGCTAMENGVCKKCGCSWRNHMHITFGQKRIEKQGINKRVESEIEKEKSDKERTEKFVRVLEEKIQKYKEEQAFIIEVSVKFGMFLRENAITVYNDSVADYLRYLIQEEESKPWKTENDRKLLKNLNETLEHYEAEIRVLQEVIDRGGKRDGIPEVKEVRELEEKLYALELSGEDIRRNVEANRSASSKALSYAEKPLELPVRKDPAECDDKEKKKRWILF